MNNYRERLVEVDEVLRHLSIQNFNKIPKNIINIISENKDKDYIWKYDKNLTLEQQKLNRDAIVILSWINMEYLLNPEQREFMKQIHEKNEKILENKKKEMFNVKEMFKNKEKNIDKEVCNDLIEFKEKNIFQRILDKIKNWFKNRTSTN